MLSSLSRPTTPAGESCRLGHQGRVITLGRWGNLADEPPLSSLEVVRLRHNVIVTALLNSDFFPLSRLSVKPNRASSVVSGAPGEWRVPARLDLLTLARSARQMADHLLVNSVPKLLGTGGLVPSPPPSRHRRTVVALSAGGSVTPPKPCERALLPCDFVWHDQSLSVLLVHSIRHPMRPQGCFIAVLPSASW